MQILTKPQDYNLTVLLQQIKVDIEQNFNDVEKRFNIKYQEDANEYFPHCIEVASKEGTEEWELEDISIQIHEFVQESEFELEYSNFEELNLSSGVCKIKFK